jgi:hypothetical protein
VPAFVDRTGQVIGRLTVLARAANDPQGRIRWLCRCECGTEVVVLVGNLGKNTNSCGCLRRDVLASRPGRHGMTGTPTWWSWICMRQRCSDPRVYGYSRYGGRGITVCERWLHSFENFLADMGERPDGMTLDRIDNDGNYEPGNCRWATSSDQNNNRSDNKIRKG